MTQDRELLELAALAAGYALKWGEVYMLGDDEIDCTDEPYVVSGQPDEADWHWDPLHDDGDALRLAVKLNFNVCKREHEVEIFNDDNGEFLCSVSISEGDDPYAATRLAITRAAAAIGKAMQESEKQG